jgi:hypothetical protein
MIIDQLLGICIIFEVLPRMFLADIDYSVPSYIMYYVRTDLGDLSSGGRFHERAAQYRVR